MMFAFQAIPAKTEAPETLKLGMWEVRSAIHLALLQQARGLADFSFSVNCCF